MSVDKEFVTWFKLTHPPGMARYWVNGHHHPEECVEKDFAVWWNRMDPLRIRS